MKTLPEEKKPIIKDHLLCDSIYVKCPEQKNPERDGRLVVARLGQGVGAAAAEMGSFMEGGNNVPDADRADSCTTL